MGALRLSFRKWILVLGIGACLLPALPVWGTADEELESRIRRAETLNLTLPREESEVMVAELAAEMEGATPDQKVRVAFLQSRNKAIAGQYDEAMALIRPLFDRELEAELELKVVRLAANIALQRDDFEQAYRFLLQGLKLIPEVEAARPKTNLLALLAYFYGAAGEAEQAIKYGRQALEIAEMDGDARDVCVALHDLSVAQERAGQMDDALTTRRRALEICRDAKDPIHLGTSLVKEGYLGFRKDGDPAVVDQMRAGIAMLEEAGYRDGVLNGHYELAQVLMQLGRPDEAERLLRPLVVEFEEYRLWAGLSDTHDLLSRITEERGEYREALEHHQAAEAAGDRHFDRERAMRVAYLQVELDTRQKEQQIELLREQNRVLELREESQRQRRYLAFGGVAALSIIGLLLFLLLIHTRSDRRNLLWLSQHDGLTGLLNHTSFFRRANEALEICQKSRQPFTLVVADIDHFKEINDRHGHDLGDRVLREIGALLREVFWPQGIVGRIGGEEFGMALPGLQRDRARELIDEFNERLADKTELGETITLSYGVIETRRQQSVERLRRLGDQALYEAKRRGRNCVVDASEVSDEAALQVPMNRRADDPR